MTFVNCKNKWLPVFFCRAQLLFSTIVARVSPLPEALSVSKMVLSVSAPSWRGGGGGTWPIFGYKLAGEGLEPDPVYDKKSLNTCPV